MSVEAARAFIELLQTQPEVIDHFYTANPQSTEEILGFARQQGWSFTAAEYLQAVQDYPDEGILKYIREQLHPDDDGV